MSKIHRLEDVLARIAKAATQVRGGNEPDAAAVADALDRIAVEATRPPTLALLGEFNAGKSKLINSLLGEDVLPTDCLPTTARPALVQFGARRGIVLNRASGARELRDVEALRLYGDKSRGAEGDLANVDRIEVFLPIDSLKQLQYLDTPGVDDPGQDEAITLQAVAAADAVIWCTQANAAWKATEKTFWERVPPSLRGQSILLITHADALNNDSDRERVLARVRRDAGDRFARIEMAGLVDAARARRDGKVVDQNLWMRSGVPSVQQAIKELILDHASALRADWAARAACAVLGRRREILAGQFGGLENTERRVREADEKVRAALVLCQKEIEAAAEKAASRLNGLGSWIAQKATAIKVQRTFHEPVEVVEEGLFVDDHKVEYRNRRYDTLDFDRIEGLHKELVEKLAETFDNRLHEAIVATFASFEERYRDACQNAFREEAEIVQALRALAQVQAATLQYRAEAVFGHLDGAGWGAWGSVGGGGLYGYFMIRERDGQDPDCRRMPVGAELKDAVNAWFEFAWAAEHVVKVAAIETESLADDVSQWLEELKTAVVGRLESLQERLDELEGIRCFIEGGQQTLFQPRHRQVIET